MTLKMMHTFVDFSSQKSAIPMLVSGFLLSFLFCRVYKHRSACGTLCCTGNAAFQNFSTSVVTQHLHKVINSNTSYRCPSSEKNRFLDKHIRIKKDALPKVSPFTQFCRTLAPSTIPHGLVYVVYLIHPSETVHHNAFLLQPVLDKTSYNKPLI